MSYERSDEFHKAMADHVNYYRMPRIAVKNPDFLNHEHGTTAPGAIIQYRDHPGVDHMIEGHFDPMIREETKEERRSSETWGIYVPMLLVTGVLVWLYTRKGPPIFSVPFMQ